jgi:Multicopper oxidase
MPSHQFALVLGMTSGFFVFTATGGLVLDADRRLPGFGVSAVAVGGILLHSHCCATRADFRRELWMNPPSRTFVTGASALAGIGIAGTNRFARGLLGPSVLAQEQAVDYTLHIKTSAIEVAPKRIISATTYNGQFPGPLLRFKEGREVTVDIHNDTDTPEQLHWHGQRVIADVDCAHVRLLLGLRALREQQGTLGFN